MIDRAKRQGLANLRAVVVVPILDEDHADVDGEIQDDLREKLESVVDQSNIKIRLHSEEVPWRLAIDGQKTITQGKDGSSSSGEDEEGEDEDGEDEDGEDGEDGEGSEDDDDSEDGGDSGDDEDSEE
uniref:Uncharacterized protein n=1 Tax=Bionectria ochroleuca TaxID=29856 RepID=A0A8H7NC77_BIOOC